MAIPERMGGETVGTESPFTPKQRSRLERFAHMLGQADAMEGLLRQGAELTLKAKQGRGSVDVYPITDETIHTVRKTAFHMYDGELKKDPLTREAADEMLRERRRIQTEQSAKDKKEEDERLRKMWDA